MTTTISLRQASAISDSISAQLKGVIPQSTVAISEHLDAIEQTTAAANALRECVDTHLEALAVVAELRASIGRANVEAGVSDILAQQAYTSAAIGFLETVIGAPQATDIRAVEGALARARVSEHSQLFGCVVNIKPKDLHDQCVEKYTLLRQSRIKDKDRLVHLNVTTKIPLSAATEAYLQKHKYI